MRINIKSRSLNISTRAREVSANMNTIMTLVSVDKKLLNVICKEQKYLLPYKYCTVHMQRSVKMFKS